MMMYGDVNGKAGDNSEKRERGTRMNGKAGDENEWESGGMRLN